jgi:hypothetical protein
MEKEVSLIEKSMYNYEQENDKKAEELKKSLEK